MIKTLRVTDSNKTCVDWWPKVPWLQDKTEFNFSPGLNIVFGPNGSGKSTLLKALARLTYCEQGGFPYVTPTGQQCFQDGRFGLDLIQDGQGVLYAAADSNNGLIGGLAGFDFDFSSQGVVNAQFKGSQGESTMERCLKFIIEALEGKVPEVRWKAKKPIPSKHNRPGLHERRLALWEKMTASLEARTPKGPPTIILDEPSRSLSLPLQDRVWSRIYELSKTWQVIVATHSPYALRYVYDRDVKWWETQRNYKVDGLVSIVMLGRQIDEAALARLAAAKAKKAESDGDLK